MTDRSGRWLVLAAVLGALALGLPWDGGAPGFAQPSRVLVVAAAALVVTGLRTSRPVLVRVAVVVAAGAALLGGWTTTPGRSAVAAAAVCLAVGARTLRRRAGG